MSRICNILVVIVLVTASAALAQGRYRQADPRNKPVPAIPVPPRTTTAPAESPPLRGGSETSLATEAAPAPAGAAAAPAPSAQEWENALAVVRNIALDAVQPAQDRSAAITALARLLGMRGQDDEGLKLCKQVMDNPGTLEVAEAAVRAGCLLCRHRDGHLGAAAEQLAKWRSSAQGPAVTAIEKVAAELRAGNERLMAVAARQPVPPVVGARMPAWGVAAAGTGPAVLNIPRPPVAAPAWTARATPEKGPACLEVAVPVFAPPAWSLPESAGNGPRALSVTPTTYSAPAWTKQIQWPPPLQK